GHRAGGAGGRLPGRLLPAGRAGRPSEHGHPAGLRHRLHRRAGPAPYPPGPVASVPGAVRAVHLHRRRPVLPGPGLLHGLVQLGAAGGLDHRRLLHLLRLRLPPQQAAPGGTALIRRFVPPMATPAVAIGVSGAGIMPTTNPVPRRQPGACLHPPARPAMETTASTQVPDPKAPLPRQIPYIIGNEACERFSFYGMRNILVEFLIGSVILAALPMVDREGYAKDVF